MPAFGFVVAINDQGRPISWWLSNPSDFVPTNNLNRITKAVRFYLATDAYSSAGRDSELNSVRSAFREWSSVPGTAVRFEDAGLAGAGVDINTGDGSNTVHWAKSSTLVNGGLDDIRGLLGQTFLSLSTDYELVEADIVFNGFDFQWFTDFFDPSSPHSLVESTALHEIGHFIGLDHSPVGGATMLARGGTGVDTQAGLSPDDMAFAQSVYYAKTSTVPVGAIQGKVSKGGAAVFGAAVFIETTNGIVVQGTVSRADGSYVLPGIAPGDYKVRAAPLDPRVQQGFLVTGADIHPDFAGADLVFLPSGLSPVVVQNKTTNTVNLSVTASAPAFNISGIRPPAVSPNSFVYRSGPVQVKPGQQDVSIGVYGLNLPSDGVLSITGDGFTIGAPVFTATPFSGSNLKLLTVKYSLAANATPGLRSFVVTRGTSVAYANGFLEVLPAMQDFNFDGLDDVFQRKYFPDFTAPAAAPNNDFDGDGLTNEQEYLAGTDPTSKSSTLKLTPVAPGPSGPALKWATVVGKKYQVLYKETITATNWIVLGTVIGDGSPASFQDLIGTNRMRFYRIQVVP